MVTLGEERLMDDPMLRKSDRHLMGVKGMSQIGGLIMSCTYDINPVKPVTVIASTSREHKYRRCDHALREDGILVGVLNHFRGDQRGLV